MVRGAAFGLGLLALVLPASGKAREPPLQVTNVTIIDGTGAVPREARTVFVRDGIIIDIRDADPGARYAICLQ